MTGPIRLLESSNHPGIEALLRAGIDEQPRAAALQRTALAIGVSTSITSAAAAASAGAATSALAPVTAAAPTALSLAMKWIGIGALGGLGLAGGTDAVVRLMAPPPVTSLAHVAAAPPIPASAGRASTPAETPHRVDLEPEPPALPAMPKTPALLVPLAPRTLSTPVAALPANASLPDAQSLTLEVAAIDAARAALTAGNAALALQRLDDYAALPRTGTLEREAQLLRIDALSLAGRTTSARALLQSYAERFPQDPRLNRLRSLLEEK
jgi:hypothetical protein